MINVTSALGLDSSNGSGTEWDMEIWTLMEIWIW
jgi:hypothetical protein